MWQALQELQRAERDLVFHVREPRDLDRVWLHADLDVLDQKVMHAVDSPGSPGLDFEQLAEVLSRCVGTGRVIGLDVTIYDPELDPEGGYVPSIVDCLSTAVASLPS